MTGDFCIRETKFLKLLRVLTNEESCEPVTYQARPPQAQPLQSRQKTNIEKASVLTVSECLQYLKDLYPFCR